MSRAEVISWVVVAGLVTIFFLPFLVSAFHFVFGHR
jgi:hypothetical protein